MERKEITKLLTDTLIDRLSKYGKYYSTEVTVDIGLETCSRVDVMEFTPDAFNDYVSGVEKGYFTCYEIKSCYEDVYSGNGLNFYGEKNYIVTTMETYKKLIPDFESGKFKEHLKKTNPESCEFFGVMVLVPDTNENYNKKNIIAKEVENPTELTKEIGWKLYGIKGCFGVAYRKKPVAELLFCMVRANSEYSWGW